MEILAVNIFVMQGCDTDNRNKEEEIIHTDRE